MRRLSVLALVVLLSAGVSAARADSIRRAEITVNAESPGELRVTSALTVRVEGSEARGTLELFLSRAVEVVAAEADGRTAAVRPEDVPGTLLRRWTVDLPEAIPSGESAVIRVETEVSPSGAAGIRPAPDGGFLLPGSGWFPQLAPETDELPVHSTTFRLPAGRTTVAAGTASDGGSWTTTTGARPFAVWGEYEVTRIAGEPAFEVWRRPGRSGEVPRLDRIRRLVEIVATGLSASGPVPSWKLVDLGEGVVAGGLGTVFWDETRAASGAEGTLLDRDLAGAIATTFWTEHFRTVGPHAAWLSRSMAAYLGDVACIALDDADIREPTEAAVISPRRRAFLDGLAEDRSLAGVVPVSEPGPRLLATRGVLAAHALAEAAGSRTRWLVCIGDFRNQHGGASVDLETFREFVGRTFSTHHDEIWPLLDGTALPRFAISDHRPVESHGRKRYRVEVENRGEATGAVEVVTLASGGYRLRGSRLLIPAGEKKAVVFDQPGHIARIVIDPRGVVMQSALEDQVVELTPAVLAPASEYVPAFEFYTETHTGYLVEDFSLDLEGVSISGFDGHLVPFSTHHGPSGAALIGQGDVTITPGGPFVAGFEKAMGTDSVTFPAARNMWIRFPLSSWERIEPQLGAEEAEDEKEVVRLRRWIHGNMFRSDFFTENRAQVPPPGSSLVVFVAGDEEWRGFVRHPLPNGRVEMRLWDNLRKKTIWEEIR